MASTKLTKTFSGDGNRQKYTISFWVKRSSLGNQFLFNTDGGNEETYLRFKSGDSLQWFEQNSSAATQANRSTNQLFRDFHGWYHIVITRDSTQSTATDRLKFYINGTLNTSWAEDATPAQNTNTRWNNNVEHMIGVGVNGSSNYFDGLMTHIHFCDGYAYAASDFGSTDSTTGEWKINTSPSVSYGTNGYFMFKDDNSVNDDSGNGNNFTLTAGTLTKTEDNPSNIFCTMNPLQHPDSSITSTFANGNTSMSGNNSHWQRAYGTIAAKSTGKWYYEWKATATSSDNNRVGWDSIDLINEGTDSYYSGLTIDGAGELRGGVRGHSGYSPDTQMTAISGGNFSFGTNDFLGMAIDLDNQTISVYKNGTLEINAYSYSGASNCSILKSRGHFIAPSVNFHSTSGNANTSSFNFGNGAFGSTQLTGTTYTDSNSQGVFKYQPPTNYLAWCTKNLNV